MRVKIIVDSTTDLTAEVKRRVDIVPLTVHFGNDTFIDGVTITHEEFYEKLTSGTVLPRTSQPSPDAFTRAFAQATEDGSQAVVLTAASALSGTYQSACIAAEDYPGVYVVDSETVAIGTGILTQLALQLADEGLSANELTDRLNLEKKNIYIAAIVDTLEFLQRGGRLSKTAAIAGGLLNIKPLLSIQNGQIAMLGKARGIKQGCTLLNRKIADAGVNFDRPVMLGYTGAQDTLLTDYIRESGDLWPAEPPRTIIGSVIGTHAGPGAVAVAFFRR